MEKLCAFFIVALVASESITLSNGLVRAASDLPSIRIPRQNSEIQPRMTTVPTTNGGSPTTTTMSPSVKGCIRKCPVTAEYNPVCGTDLVVYFNPGRLYCAQACGVVVEFLSPAPCPTTTVAPPQTTKKV